MSLTIFSKIIRREIPATIVYEDDEFLAFMDIAPVAKGHLLLIPKEEYAWMQDAPDELVGKTFTKAKALMLGLKKSLGCDYVQLVVAGDEVPHFHIHLIPRHHGAKIFGEHRPEVKYADDEMETTAEKIREGML